MTATLCVGVLSFACLPGLQPDISGDGVDAGGSDSCGVREHGDADRGSDAVVERGGVATGPAGGVHGHCMVGVL